MHETMHELCMQHVLHLLQSAGTVLYVIENRITVLLLLELH